MLVKQPFVGLAMLIFSASFHEMIFGGEMAIRIRTACSTILELTLPAASGKRPSTAMALLLS